MDAAEEWEGIAAEILGETGCDSPPVDAFELAKCCRLSARAWMKSHARLDGDEIRYPAEARRERQHGLIAHEVGHWALKRARAQNVERGAKYLAGAFMLPRRHFDHDLRRTWSIDELRAKHINVSAEMIAWRIVQLRDAVATILDDGKMRYRAASDSITGAELRRRMTALERELADEALERGETVRSGPRCYAVPIIDPPHRRVIVVCEAEQLGLKF